MKKGIEIMLNDQQILISLSRERLLKSRLKFYSYSAIFYGLIFMICFSIWDILHSLFFLFFSLFFWFVCIRFCLFWHRKRCIAITKNGEQDYLINYADPDKRSEEMEIMINEYSGKKRISAVGDMYLQMSNGYQLILMKATQPDVDAVICNLNRYFGEELVVNYKKMY